MGAPLRRRKSASGRGALPLGLTRTSKSSPERPHPCSRIHGHRRGSDGSYTELWRVLPGCSQSHRSRSSSRKDRAELEHLLPDTIEIAYAIPVRILKGPRVDLIDCADLPPHMRHDATRAATIAGATIRDSGPIERYLKNLFFSDSLTGEINGVGYRSTLSHYGHPCGCSFGPPLAAMNCTTAVPALNHVVCLQTVWTHATSTFPVSTWIQSR
jgi:hypothetical protein